MYYQKRYKSYDKSYSIKLDRDTKEDSFESSKVDKLLFIMFGIILLVVPIIMFSSVRLFISPEIDLAASLQTGEKYNLFDFYKYVSLVIFTIGTVLIFLYKLLFLNNQLKPTMFNIIFGVLAVFILLSLLFSPYKTIALHGMYTRYEGAITYLCYIILAFIAANIVFNKDKMKWLFYMLIPFILINTTLILLDFFGVNILDFKWVQDFLFSSIEGANMNSDSKILSTLSNPNYVSGVGAIITVLFFYLGLFESRFLASFIYYIFALLGFVLVITSFSTSGFLTLIATFPITLILALLLFKNSIKKPVKVLFFFVGMIIIYCGMYFYNPAIWNETLGFFIPAESENTIHTDSNTEQGKSIVSNDEIQSESGYALEELPEPAWGAGTGRVYIWEKTVELVKDKPLLGYGLDTLPFIFPQEDPEKIANLSTHSVIVDKPHNIFIGLLYGSGLLTLLAFLAFIIVLFVHLIKFFIKHRKTMDTKQISIVYSIAVALVAYLIQGLFNDSVIGISVIIWILLGVLISVTTNMEEQTENNS
ncbi:O-antigen ligase family protein [Bacillus sp. Marseille-P3661]|uniref:O-antigen ligase family protein n=1 Tax=Bacillus sp. Marseille-P3661 TaxID=1936234 RepID=UPI000C826F5D|nr:O-antigen ligase family protein [Bacillus sp. Marseille-P3661]